MLSDRKWSAGPKFHFFSDLGSFFKAGFKKIKNKTLNRRTSLGSKVVAKPTAIYQPSEQEKAKENCPDNALVTRESDVTREEKPIMASTPTVWKRDVSDSHNEIFIQMGEEVQAHTLQVI